MDIEIETRKNTENINSLTVTMTRLATVVENSEKRHDSDMQNFKEVVVGIRTLTERIGSLVGVEKDVATMRESIASLAGEIRGELGKHRHDIANIANAQQAMPAMAEKINDNQKDIATLAAKIEGLTSWQTKKDGGIDALTGAGKAFWTVFGAGILAIGGFFLHFYFKSNGVAG